MNTHKPLSKTLPATPQLLCAAFNQDQGCFAIGHELGFRVYNADPMQLKVKRNFDGGIGSVAMLHRTNYLALIGGGRAPKFPGNKVIIWDDLKRKSSLVIEFMDPVMRVLLSRIRIVVVVRNRVHVYGFLSPPKPLAVFDTAENGHGIADLSVNATPSDAYQILAFPGRTVGQIQLVDVSPKGQERNLVSLIKAHKAPVRCLVLNRLGTMVASASEKGTIIRVHSTTNTSLLHEFRRGLDRAVVTSMAFSPNGSKLAVLSDKLTLHVFNVSLSGANRKHVLNRLTLPLPQYFQSTWSFVSARVDDHVLPSDEGVLGWSGEDCLVLVWKAQGIWEKYCIIEKDGDEGKEWTLVKEGWRGFGELG
ncbi:hypothetical protein BABINDRAFT_9361 [Babjeviella inositovora NRRL Y-12698]|uniref:SVP1-like protein 2 n=1 Tax=Babjeviella inositovora NRRL Y-12698 TaxID=984486 RepID=A0A1E3QLR9_9ASCO|nr:uncharacterized protein BABINDRAFT_9361 [Babjeviella inositovora NRRL Y-12698]ODQ78600.1 hypothetical protein BABINDRAFT_9361 [Babjeviella inositovora NRRL Y-12698]